MYEFLVPWGALAPALCAVVVYIIVSEIRRKEMLSFLEPPEGPLVPAHWEIEATRLV